MIRLSYILPVYKAGKFIDDCLESIYSQDIPLEDFEVICVDDCSPDISAEKSRNWQERYNNLVLITHTINMRAGGARNTGLRSANGEYVWFVDPDDMIVRGAASTLLSICEKESLDTLSFNMLYISENGDKTGTEERVFKDVIFL